MPDTWQDIAERKQRQRAERIPKDWLLPSQYSNGLESRSNVLGIPRQCGILSPQELHITDDLDATALVAALATGKLTAVAVVTAFCKRAAIAQQLVNCLTELFFPDALARAQQLDAQFAKTGKPTGPLHGLPISIKDSFKVRGYDASVGVAGFCFHPAQTNSALVDVLLAQGAVLYCKTNVPLTMMALDSHNNVFGRTLNPANRLLTAGGSSGGEGALLALRGSPLGVGTDVGGSIRIPAMCNGLVGVKPSHGRVPYAGQEGGALPGSSKVGIESTAGPLARSVRDCEMLLRAIGDGRAWDVDPDVLPQSWAQQMPLTTQSPSSRVAQPLRVGIVRTDGHVTPLPPIQRLLDEVAQTLRSPALPSWSAVEVVDVGISRLGPQLLKVFNGVMSIDGANTWFDHLDLTGEPLSPWLATRLRRRPQKSLDEVRKLQAQKTELQTVFQDVWKAGGGYWPSKPGDRALDLLICPVAPHTTPPIDRWNTTNYTSALNLLDLPAGVLPVRDFREADMAGELPRSEPLNGWDKINRGLWGDVDRGVYVGSMMSVQVVAPKLMERRLVEGMAVLEKALAPLTEGAGRGKQHDLPLTHDRSCKMRRRAHTKTAASKSPTTPSRGTDPGARVGGVFELTEAILDYLPPSELLRLQSVCRFWTNLIESSSLLRRKIFFDAPNDSKDTYGPNLPLRRPNCIKRVGRHHLTNRLEHFLIDLTGFFSTDLRDSWVGLPVSERPVRRMSFLTKPTHPAKKSSAWYLTRIEHQLADPEGLTLGDVVGAVWEDYRKRRARHGSACATYQIDVR
ncbi:hypothetical protein LTR53_002530 [Teratosphaeriaceae sp. CCFEE 6253]|nr:hypothetical protein LTR53_002530 [Teratosphaeriaceae sp. CCFEE 6253]